MKILISPAKSLNLESELPTSFSSEACFLNEANQLNNLLKQKSPQELSDLMSISSKLGSLNYERNQAWSLPFTKTNARQAIYAFSGDVYRGLDAYTIPEEKLEVLQNSVRIISGLYGLLKPMDLIQPYRLEMSTKFPVGKSKNLYEFWKKRVTSSLNSEMDDGDLIINLASQEYFKAIDTKIIKGKLIHVEFKEFKNGEYKTVAIFSKLARGLMTRYIIDKNSRSVGDLKNFNYDRYIFDENKSSEGRLVFTR